MRRYAFLGLTALVLVAGCASTKSAQTAQQQAASEPVKSQEATPLQRAQIKTDLAAGYYERGQFDVAIEVLDESQKIEPNYAKTYNVYGLVYTMLGETQKAEGNFQRADDGKTLVWNTSPNPEDQAGWSGPRDKEKYATGKGTLTWYRLGRKDLTGSTPSAPIRPDVGLGDRGRGSNCRIVVGAIPSHRGPREPELSFRLFYVLIIDVH